MGKLSTWSCFLFAVCAFFGMTHSASATPTPYYTAQSLTFWNVSEEAIFESDLYLYAMADPTKTYKIFSYKQEPLAKKSVSASTWGYLDDGFGFMFAIHTGGMSDTTADYKFYSDPYLNAYANGQSVDKGFDHIKIVPTIYGLSVRLDDQIRGPLRDNDYDDMVVKVAGCDLQPVAPAPVPEPTTALLFGTGIIGLAAVGRRRS